MSMYPIQSIVVPSASSNVLSFTNIPQTFTHLEIRAFYANPTTTVQYVGVGFNSDSGNNYWAHELLGNGSSASAASYLTRSNVFFDYEINQGSYSTNIFSVGIMSILDYTNTNKIKVTRTICGFDGQSAGEVMITSGAWNNTAAIQSIQLNNNGYTLSAGTRFDLYGLTSSNVGTF